MRRPTRRELPLVAVAVAVVLLVGWLVLRQSGVGDPYARYCAEVEDRRAEIGAARSAGGRVGLIRALPAFEALAEKAPEDIRDEWKIVLDRTTALRDALADADVDPASYDPEKPPEGISEEQQQAIEAAGVRLASDETVIAFAGVEQQARDVCKTPLSL